MTKDVDSWHKIRMTKDVDSWHKMSTSGLSDIAAHLYHFDFFVHIGYAPCLVRVSKSLYISYKSG